MSITILSGGQTGVDQAALRAARAASLPTAGWAPFRWRTEDGAAPWLADFGLIECPDPGYPPRTKANVAWANALLWFGDPATPGGRLTLGEARRRKLPILVLAPDAQTTDVDVAAWLRARSLGCDGFRLLLAGNRESSAPGIGLRAETFLRCVFARLVPEEQPRADPA